MPEQCLCQASREAPSRRKALSEKAHRPRSSTEGRLRANRAVLIGCQVSADEHVQRRLTARLVTMSRDGTVAKHSLAVRRCRGWWRASSPPVLTMAHASSTYIYVDTCRHADPADGA